MDLLFVNKKKVIKIIKIKDQKFIQFKFMERSKTEATIYKDYQSK